MALFSCMWQSHDTSPRQHPTSNNAYPEDGEDVVTNFKIGVYPLLVYNGFLHLMDLRIVEVVEPVLYSLWGEKEREMVEQAI